MNKYKYIKEYIRITEDWLFPNDDTKILDNNFICYKDGDKVKVSVGTINSNGETYGAVINIDYTNYKLYVRKQKINKILKR